MRTSVREVEVLDCVYVRLVRRGIGLAFSCIFFFNDTGTTEIYTILFGGSVRWVLETGSCEYVFCRDEWFRGSSYLSLLHIPEPTRLRRTSFAVFCLKKKHNP